MDELIFRIFLVLGDDGGCGGRSGCVCVLDVEVGQGAYVGVSFGG